MPTAPVASTLATWRVGGQLDESIAVPAGYEFADLIVDATLTGVNGQDVIDPTNSATVLDGPYRTVVGGNQGSVTTEPSADGETTLAGRYWWTEPLKATTAADPDNALQPTGLSWTISIGVQRRKQVHELLSYSIALEGDRDYVAVFETLTLDTTGTTAGVGGQVGDDVVNIAHLLPPPTTVPVSDAFTDRVAESIVDIPAGTIPILKLEVDIATQAELDAHNHDGTYSALGHNHADTYAPPDGSISAAKLDFDPATQAELDALTTGLADGDVVTWTTAGGFVTEDQATFAARVLAALGVDTGSGEYLLKGTT